MLRSRAPIFIEDAQSCERDVRKFAAQEYGVQSICYIPVLGGVLEQVVPSYANPQPRFLVTYCDKQLRISRDQDGKIFVYTALTADTTATDYSSATADLGVGELLSGLSKVFLG